MFQGEKMEKSSALIKLAINPQDVKSLRDIVLDSLRDAIIGGTLTPGAHLKERELAEVMGISTTPIKEALRILSQEGWVETFPRKGTYVSEMVETSIEEMLMLKSNLEGLTARLAATKITDEELKELENQVELMEQLSKQKDTSRLAEENSLFHLMIRTSARNPFICQMLINVIAFDRAFRKRALQFSIEVEAGFCEHKKIFEAIKARDADLAEARMKTHIMRTTENVLKKLKD
jgi:DNA-binding GntR family transcriptional regulator